jgi:gluconate kinase
MSTKTPVTADESGMAAPGGRPLLYVVFGLPGAGKSFVARQLGRRGFFVHDGDDDLPDDMRQAIVRGEIITTEMRDRFMAVLIDHVVDLAASHPRLVVAQTFLKARHRAQLAARLPAARFVHVVADDDLRRRRLADRNHQPLSPESVARMIAAFDFPGVPDLSGVSGVSGVSDVDAAHDAGDASNIDVVDVIDNGSDPALLDSQIDALLAFTR